MSAPAIRVQGLWKEYHVGGAIGDAKTFREMLSDAIASPIHSLRGKLQRPPQESFWALKDVSFDVQPGEVVGIIGRNGAGKSTLLKILSRITAPTKGRIEIRGRIASLLEVGTGFHPELTGRENVYLNGAILGMSRAEIRSKFDEIVDFSGVEKFLDTPVKRYSSGMQMRLAFAVAAHLDPEILVIDEVLAVGDADFQKKCLGKMGEVAKGGRTVLFVSHNLAAVQALCPNAIFLTDGIIKALGPTREIIRQYTTDTRASETITYPKRIGKIASIIAIEVPNRTINYGDNLLLRCSLHTTQQLRIALEIEIHGPLGVPLIYASTSPMYGSELLLNTGHNTLQIHIGPIHLARGDYYLYLWIIKPWTAEYDRTYDPIEFQINISDPGNTGFDFSQSYGRGSATTKIHATSDV